MDQTHETIQPAGFWIRLVAYGIDSLILAMVFYGMAIPMGLVMDLGNQESTSQGFGGMAFLYLFYLAFYLAYAIYFYTQKGGTLGKLAFNIRVVDLTTAAKLTWGQVILRETLGKFVSALILYVGFIMAGIRSDKRALHDLMANSQCLRKK